MDASVSCCLDLGERFPKGFSVQDLGVSSFSYMSVFPAPFSDEIRYSKGYFFAAIGVDTSEDEASSVCRKLPPGGRP